VANGQSADVRVVRRAQENRLDAMTFKQGLSLEDPSILTNVKEFDEIVNTYIEDIFPQ
jgi:hypothetical protein